MDKIVFGEYTVQDILIVVGVIIGLLILVAWLKGSFRVKSDVYAQQVRCDQCGWQGKVSKYAGRCPRCNNPLGDHRVSQS